MPVWSTVDSSNLQHSRIDAEFYQPIYLKEEAALLALAQTIEVQPLGALVSKPVRTGRTPGSRELRELREGDQGIHFIKTDTLREGRIDFERCDIIPARVIPRSGYLEENEVLVTIIGATHDIVGRAAIYPPNSPPAITNQNIAIIRADSRLDPLYLQAFLNSRFGRHQLWRHSRQTEQVNLNCREVERILVPLFDQPRQQQVSALVHKSIQAMKGAKNKLSQVQDLLLGELGLEDLRFEHPLASERLFSQTQDHRRLDPEFFRAGYYDLLDAMHNSLYGASSFLRKVKYVDELHKVDADRVYHYVQLSSVSETFGLITEAEEYRGKNLPSRARRLLRHRDVIISSVQGSLSKLALVTEEYDGALASTGFFQFRETEYPSEVVLVLLGCNLLQMQLFRHARGSILSAMPASDLDELIVPNIPEPLLSDVRALVQDAHALYSNTQLHLKQAVAQLERMIWDEE